MKIYTKTGDKGQTSLFGGTKVSKDNAKIEAYGTVDELNSHIGYLMALCHEKKFQDILFPIQSLLFDIGSHLASDGSADSFLPSLDTAWTERLENLIDLYNEELPELKSFILPRGNDRISYAHICRTICRRAERRVVALSKLEELDGFIIVFLNRLSDYFFVLARYLTKMDGIDEEKWSSKNS